MNDDTHLLPSAFERIKLGWTAENEAELTELKYRFGVDYASLLPSDKDSYYHLLEEKKFFASNEPPAAAGTQAADSLPSLPCQEVADADEFRKTVGDLVTDMTEIAPDLTRVQILDGLKARQDLLIKIWNASSKRIRHPFRAILSVLVNYDKSIEFDRLAAGAKRVALEQRVAELERGGAGISIEGTYNPTARYTRLAVVARDGASLIAKRDDPGPCPGDGWQLFSSQGKAGKPGPRGGIRTMSIDSTGLVTIINADGSSVTCDFAPILRKLQKE